VVARRAQTLQTFLILQRSPRYGAFFLAPAALCVFTAAIATAIAHRRQQIRAIRAIKIV
jgi:hypothetical protein